LEIVRGDAQDSPLVTPLTWGLFGAHEKPQTRRRELIVDVAASVFGRSLAGEGEMLEQTIRDLIKKNARPTVVFSTVPQGTGDEETRIQEWFAVWRDLLTEDRAKTIAVILFIESGWWPWAGSDVQRLDCGGCVVSDKMDKISRKHLDEWLGADVQRLGNEVSQRLAKEGRRLYRFHWGRHFDDISDAMQEAM
jgi:hypothetical protein